MKICKFFVVFLPLYFLTLASNINLVHKNLLGDKGVSNYVCEVIRNTLKAKNDAQDVLVKNLGDQFWSSEANDIAGCVKDFGAVVVSDFDHILTRNTLRKAAVIILMLKYITEVIF
jgi:DNA-binding protein